MKEMFPVDLVAVFALAALARRTAVLHPTLFHLVHQLTVFAMLSIGKKPIPLPLSPLTSRPPLFKLNIFI
jgi:hypothetical protein